MKNVIFLYDATEKNFTTNGFGAMSDYIEAKVTEVRNGLYEIQMTYPVIGINYDKLALRRQLLSKANPFDQTQPFRIYKVSEPENGIVTVLGRHRSYDLAGVPMNPFSVTNLSGAVIKMNEEAMIPHDFTFSTDKASTGIMSFDEPTSYRSLCGGIKGSILDTYGGDYHWDRFNVELLSNRGRRTQDNPFEVTYKRNLKSYKCVRAADKTVSGIIGIWKPKKDDTGEESIATQPVITQNTDIGSGEQQYIEVVDFSADFETQPTQEELTQHTENYIINSGHDLFDETIEFTYEEEPDLLEAVCMCDMVRVTFPRYGAVALGKCTKTVFNVGLDRFEKIEIGDTRTNLSDRIISQSRELKESKKNLIDESRQIRHELEETAEMLRSAIADNEGNTSELKHAIDSISAVVATLNNSLSLTMNDQELLLQFVQTINDKIDANEQEQSNRTSVLEKYIKAVDGALIIAIAGGAVKLKLFNDTIAFYDGADDETDMTNAFARFTNRELQVEAVICGKYLTIGKHWQILERANKHWTLWRLPT